MTIPQDSGVAARQNQTRRDAFILI